jgi:hypothetical protein
MGKARKLKQQRSMQRLRQEVYALEAQQAKKPCDTCQLVDPEAWIADPGMGHKVLASLRTPEKNRFFCHQGMPTQTRLDGTSGAYLPPLRADGSIDVGQLTPCGGFLRWSVKFRLEPSWVQFKAVMALQLKMCQRYLAGDSSDAAGFRESCGGRADILQSALNMSSLNLADTEDE